MPKAPAPHPGSVRLSRWLFASLLIGGLASAGAQPTVRVRGESRIELGADPGARAIRVHGTLRDDLGTPLPDREVILRIETELGSVAAESRTTSATGEFETRIEAGDGSLKVSAFFAGDTTHEGIHVERQIDARIADVRLSLAVPEGGQLDLDRPLHTIRLEASSRAGGGDLAVEIHDELDRLLGRTRTNAEGFAEVAIASETLGDPGAGRLTARSEGDPRRAPAQTEVALVRYRRTTTTLELAPSRTRRGEARLLHGRLSDSRGPLPGRAVGLFDGERHLGTALTDGRGDFELSIDAGEWRGEVVAVFESENPGLLASRSAGVLVEAAPSPRTPLLWLLASVLASILLLLWLGRRERRVERSVRRGRRSTAPGIESSSPRSLRAIRDVISGEVVDHRDGGAIVGAQIALEAPSGRELRLGTDGSGRFESAELEPGTWTARIIAPGYLSVSSPVTIPHRGEWTNATIRLASLRARAMGAFRRLAMRLLPSERLWPTSTTREIVDRSPEKVAEQARELEADLDRAYYGALPPTPDEVAAIEETARAIASKLEDETDAR